MSQRGGSVVTYVRYGDTVYSPVIDHGEADCIVSFEALEAARCISFLKDDGVIVTNTQQIDPMPVITGAAKYPENIIEDLSKEYKVISVDALSEAKKLGNAQVFNVVILGVAARHMDFTIEQWNAVIERIVKPKFVEINKKAFAVGLGKEK
jgi:indolepyruvate ferredoxin oxidoreductase beta subunit